MTYCKHLFIEIPDCFPLVPWEGLLQRGKLAVSKEDESSGEFSRAMGCVVFRYRSCLEALSRMLEDWHASKGQLSHEGQYAQQRDLFTFFSSGLSAIESNCYACYVIAAKLHPDRLHWEEQKTRRLQTEPRKLPDLLKSVYPRHQLCITLESLSKSQEWKVWNDIRNTMIHRSLQSRLVEACGGGTPSLNQMVKYASSWSNPELRADENEMWCKLSWLSGQIGEICTTGSTL